MRLPGERRRRSRQGEEEKRDARRGGTHQRGARADDRGCRGGARGGEGIPGVAGRASQRGEAAPRSRRIAPTPPPPSRRGARAAAAAAEAEAFRVAAPEGADPLDARTPTRDDVGGRFRGGAVARLRGAARDGGRRLARGGTGVAPLGARGRRWRRAARRARDGQASREAARRGGGRTRRVGGARCRTRARDHLEGCFRIRGRRRSRSRRRREPTRRRRPRRRRARSISCRWCLRAHAIARPRGDGNRARRAGQGRGTPERASRASRNARVRRARALRRRRRGERGRGGASGSRSSVSSFGNARGNAAHGDALRPRERRDLSPPRPHPTSSRSTWTSGSSPEAGRRRRARRRRVKRRPAAAPAGAVAAVGTGAAVTRRR